MLSSIFIVCFYFISIAQTTSCATKADVYFLTNYDSAIFYYNKALVNIKNEHQQMHCLSNLSVMYDDIGRVDTAINLMYSAIEIGLRNQYDSLLAEAYLRLGNYYKELDDIEDTKFYYKKSIDINFNRGACGALGILYSHLGQSDSAIMYLNKSLGCFLQSDTSKKEIKTALSSIYGQIAITYFDTDKEEKAFKYFEKSLEYAKKAKNPINIISVMLNVSSAYSFLDSTESAEVYLKKALMFSDSIGDLRIKNNINQRLYEYYFNIKDYKQAYIFLFEYQSTKDSLINLKYQKSFRKKEKEFNKKLLKYKLSNIQLEQEKQKMIYVFVSSIALIVFVILLISFIKKLKIKNLETDNLKSHLKQIINRMSDLNNHISKQNRYIVEIQKQYELNHSNKELKEELERRKIIRDEDWSKYVNVFKVLYPDFLDNVISVFPNLSEGDKKQLIMLKLNYSREKSAQILGVSPDSIKKARQRLSKKMKLKDVTELYAYVLN